MSKISLEIRKNKQRYIMGRWTFKVSNTYVALMNVYKWKQKGIKGPSNPEHFPDIILTEQLTTWYD